MSLGLDKLKPSRYGTGKSYLTDEEWREVAAAFKRGVSVSDIYKKVGRYKSLYSFRNAFYEKRNGK